MHFRKSGLAIALALAAGSTLAADESYVHVSLDPHGLGQGLTFPYFTTNNGQSTLITVQNTSAEGKALKLSVRNGLDGYDTLNINVYVPPFGKWSGALTRADETAKSRLIAGIPSVGCTIPAMPEGGFELGVAYREEQVFDVHEGSVDIVEMGTLSEALSALAREGSAESCAEFTRRADPDNGIWSTAPNDGIEAPSGLLKGSATLLDVAEGTAFSYDVPAFNGLAYKARHTTYDSSFDAPTIDFTPVLADIQTPPESAGMEFNVRGSDGQPVTLRYGNNGLFERPIRGFAVIGSLLATTQATASFFTNPDLRARTEWIVSFPTYAANNVEIYPPELPPGIVLFQPPFEYRGETLQVKTWDTLGNALAPQPPVFLGKAVNVIRFAQGDAPTSPQLATEDSPLINLAADAGTVQLDFKTVGDEVRRFHAAEGCQMLAGLPAWVLAVQSYDNDNAQQGRIATFPVEELAAGPVEVMDCGAPD